MWVEFVVGSRLAPRVFLRVLRFSSLHKNCLNSNSIGTITDEEPPSKYAIIIIVVVVIVIVVVVIVIVVVVVIIVVVVVIVFIIITARAFTRIPSERPNCSYQLFVFRCVFNMLLIVFFFFNIFPFFGSTEET